MLSLASYECSSQEAGVGVLCWGENTECTCRAYVRAVFAPCASERRCVTEGWRLVAEDAFMAEWSRRQTQVLVLSEGVGSNPTECSHHLFTYFLPHVAGRWETQHTRTPPIAQLVERETVAVTQRISLGPWFESGWVDLFFFCPPVLWHAACFPRNIRLTHSLTHYTHSLVREARTLHSPLPSETVGGCL